MSLLDDARDCVIAHLFGHSRISSVWLEGWTRGDWYKTGPAPVELVHFTLV